MNDDRPSSTETSSSHSIATMTMAPPFRLIASSATSLALAAAMLLLACNNYAAAETATPLTPEQHLQAQVSWIESRGGYFSPKISYHPVDPNDPTSYRAMHVTKQVDKDEILMVIPHKCLLMSESNNFCATVETLAKEYELGQKSEFYPYVNYCFDKRFDGDLPSTWSEEGKALLRRIAGRDLIAPVSDNEDFDVAGMEYEELCGSYNDNPTENDLKAYLHVLRRSWDDKMLPVYDMVNHRNPPYTNVDSNSPHEGNDVYVVALRDIEPGEQLYLSYNECTDCMFEKDYAFNYGTHKLLRDYGFVESYPQRWTFFNGELWFGLEEKVPNPIIGSGQSEYSGTGSPLELVWFGGALTLQDIEDMDLEVHLQGHLKLLRDIPVRELAKDLRPHEAYTSVQFHEALMTALKHLIWYVEDFNDEVEWGGTDSHPVIYGVGDKPLQAYNITEADWTYDNKDENHLEYYVEFNEQTCPDDYLDDILMKTGKDVSQEYSPRYERIGKVQSFHQLMTFWQSREGAYEDKDVVMKIERNWESCQSNRAHYHEMFVHYPASFIPKVKRVMFLGGGDNMILHEVLKYDSLEVVVGLELDKGVNQGSFFYFETLPHFDNPKVEWWFGDAKKSLQLLPKSYLASFDLIYVDMQNKIVTMLNIMEDVHRYAHPTHGIILRNEDGGFGTNEPYAVHNVDCYDGDVPVFCHQPFTMGSNVMDFMTAERTLHEDVAAKNVYYGPVVPIDQRFGNWHNYRREDKFGEDANKVVATSSPITAGVLMVLELEHISADSISADMISKALKTAGMSVSETHSFNNGLTMVFIAQEGYVLVRFFPQEQYCAFDVKLWSGQDKMYQVKESLVEALGSKVTSSYRIVSAGVDGVMNNDDNNTAGDDKDVISPNCEDGDCKAVDVDPAFALPIGQQHADAAIKEVLTSLVSPQESLEILVLCGEVSETCEAQKAAQEYSSTSTITSIHACPASQPVFTCESEFRALIRSITKRGKKVDAILIDALVPKQSGQILHRILSRAELRGLALSDTVAVASMRIENELTSSTDQTSSSPSSIWLRVLLDRFRTEFYPYNPSFHAEVVFYPPSNKKSEAGLRASLYSANNGNFYSDLVKTVDKIATTTGLTVPDIKYIKNGMNNYAADFVPTVEFGRKSYFDRIAARKQRGEQMFWGRQTVWQYEAKAESSQYTSISFYSGTPPLKTQLERVLSLMEIKREDYEVHSAKIGENGGMIFALFKGGDASVLYDGKSQLDLNLFTLNQDKMVHDNFEKHFAKTVPSLSLQLGDMQPRGTGRVVAFENDYLNEDKAHGSSIKDEDIAEAEGDSSDYEEDDEDDEEN